MKPLPSTSLPYVFVVLLCWAHAPDTTRAQTDALPRATPESQGVDTRQLISFVEAANRQVDSLHSLMVLRHGKVIAEAWWAPEAADKPHVLWSLSKSFTSTAVGLAVAEQRLSIDDPVLKYFPEQRPDNVSENLAAMKVRDLLTMSAGHQDEFNWRSTDQWRQGFLEHPVPYKPGTHFRYNTPATHMLAAIIKEVTDENVVDYLQPRLFTPLGIAPPRWDESPEGITIGGYGLFLKTEDIAKFGQLYLQQGKWNDQQLIPADWIKMATSKQVSNGDNPESDWNQGYGFQFWRCRHNAFRGDGKDGQFCIVLPELDAVIVLTANTGNMQAELNVVWDHLLAAFHEQPLPANPTAQQAWKEQTANLKATR